jgi:hypothetical protein
MPSYFLPSPFEEERPMIRLSAVVSALLLVGFVLADEKTATTTITKGRLPTSWSKLGLTDAQKTQVAQVQAKYRTQMESLRQQLRAVEQQQRAELDKILTDAQRARLREIILEKAGSTSTKPATDDAKKP